MRQSEADVNKEGRLQCGRHVVAQLVEKQERENQQSRPQSLPTDEFAKWFDYRFFDRARRTWVTSRFRNTENERDADKHKRRDDDEDHVPGKMIREN